MKRDEKDLLNLFRVLSSEQQTTLMEFAEFLAARTPVETPPISEPVDIPRPESEKVVQAIKRLRATYPMLDHSKMLYEVSEYMTQHLVMGKPATEVIDTLEILFRQRYDEMKNGS